MTASAGTRETGREGALLGYGGRWLQAVHERG
jgi:hypothetical protein